MAMGGSIDFIDGFESDAPKNEVDVVHYDYKHKMDSGKRIIVRRFLAGLLAILCK